MGFLGRKGAVLLVLLGRKGIVFLAIKRDDIGIDTLINTLAFADGECKNKWNHYSDGHANGEDADKLGAN